YVALALTAIAALVMAPGILWYFVLRKPAGAAAATTAATAGPPMRRVPIRSSPSRGPADPPLTLVEVGAFWGPYTRVAEPTLQNLFERYPSKVRLVWKDYPMGLHLVADDAATLAREALRQKGPDVFWRVHDKLLSAARLGRPVLDRIAAEEGLDSSAVSTALRDGRHRTAIDADVDLAYAIGIRAVPWFLVNGRAAEWDAKLHPEALEKAFAEALADSRQRMAAGVPAAAVYEAVQREADPTPMPVKRITLPDPSHRPSRGGPAQSALLVHEFCDLSRVEC